MLASLRKWVVRAPVLIAIRGCQTFYRLRGLAPSGLPVSVRVHALSVARFRAIIFSSEFPSVLAGFRFFCSLAPRLSIKSWSSVRRSSVFSVCQIPSFGNSEAAYVQVFITTLRRSVVIRCLSIWHYLDESSISSDSVIVYRTSSLEGSVLFSLFFVPISIRHPFLFWRFGHGPTQLYFLVFALNWRLIWCTSVRRNC